MTDELTAKIERIIEDHTLIDGADECTCGCLWEIQDGFTSTDGSTCYDNHLANLIANFVTRYLPPVFASAIHAYVDSELAAISHHGSADEYLALKRLNQNAAGIANYATTNRKWNGE